MEQHPIPRQITTFEFKLIGFMTLKQFLYLVIFVPLGFIVFKLFPIPILNILLAIILVIFGLALAFFPINDRPLEVWVRNFIKRLSSPTQYFFHKHNPPIKIFDQLYFISDPHKVMTHIESQQKLTAYLTQTNKITKPAKFVNMAAIPQPRITPAIQQQPVEAALPSKPFLIGEIKNNKKIPLPGILIYIKDESNSPVRLLKTNPHGIFATYNPLSSKEYLFEIKDPKEIYFFDTIKIKVEGPSVRPLEFYSKEML